MFILCGKSIKNQYGHLYCRTATYDTNSVSRLIQRSEQVEVIDLILPSELPEAGVTRLM